MAQYQDQINKLATIAGYAINTFERTPLLIVEDEIANLSSMIESKKEAVRELTQKLEEYQIRLRAEKEIEQQFDDEIKEDLTSFRANIGILNTYIGTLESKDDFLINKIVNEIGNHNQTIWDQLKLVHDRAVLIKGELGKMRELQRECDELRQKIQQ